MSQTALIGILVALVVVGGIVWFLLTQRRRTEALKSQYGPEYSRAVREAGSQRAAEQELLKRQERVEQLEIRPLVAEQREGFVQRWRSIQALFVDDPSGAISRADALVEEVMRVRGYPVADFDRRAADLSVYHAAVIDNYRGAREIAERHRRNAATTEDLRKAMMYYRALFQDLLEDRENAADRAAESVADRTVDRGIQRDVSRVADRTARAVNDGRERADQPIPRIDRNPRP
jgi:hypothetical protein